MYATQIGGYSTAVLAVAMAIAIRLLIEPWVGGAPNLLVFVPAVLLSALAGAGPALLATALSVAAAAVIQGVFEEGLTTDEGVSLAIFAATSIGISVGGWWLATARQLSDRNNDELRAERAYLQSVLATVPDAIMVIDDKGTLASFSPSSERMFGYTSAEVVGQNVKVLMPSPYRQNHDSYLDRYRETGQRRIIGIGRVVVGQRKDGSTFPLELSVGEMNLPSGRYFTGFIRDLTERQQTEARLQELQSELVHVSRLTAMGEMASALAHELNQPLSAIGNYLRGSQRLLEAKAGEAVNVEVVRDALGKAGDQALRAGEIIRRLRDFVARGESERRIESLSKLIEEAAALALVGAKEQRVQTRFQLDHTIDSVVADKVQIQQVLINLLRNGIDAMQDSERRELVVSTRKVDGDMVEIAVSDTGGGIAPEIADKLFQPFVTSKRTGMGVGLSISRTIVEAHGGTIRAEPNPPHGTVFRFTLRLPVEEAVNA